MGGIVTSKENYEHVNVVDHEISPNFFLMALQRLLMK